MTKKTGKLKPVVGLAVAGLIGTAYAQCYFPHSDICAQANVQVGTLDLSCNHFTPLKAKTDWWAADMLTGTLISGGIGRVSTISKECCGTATYLGCDGQNHDINNFCSWDVPYNAPDPAANSCSS